MKSRRCRMCNEPHNRLVALCASCVRVKSAHKNEVMRQESRLMLKGWLPRSGMATGRLTSNTAATTNGFPFITVARSDN